MRNKSVQVLVESGVMVALATILNMIQVYTMPNGGSVTPGSMVPILFLAWRRGVKAGVIAGVAFGVMDFMFKPYFLHWAQFFLDYLLAFGILGLFGLWKGRKSIVNVSIGVAIIAVLRLVIHIASGVIFWSEGMEFGPALAFSASYNASYMIPEAIIALIIMLLLTRREWNVE